MTNTEIDFQIISDALDARGINGYSIRNDYSGRGMYGDSCFGITFEDGLRAALVFFASLGYYVGEQQHLPSPDFEDDFADKLASAARYDQMGLSIIVYFPRYTLINVPDYALED
jgi:hypothetical protein